MQCYSCGRDIGRSLGLCSQCKARRATLPAEARHQINLSLLNDEESRDTAGFHRRSLAYLLDAYLIALGCELLSILVLQPLFSFSITGFCTQRALEVRDMVLSHYELSIPLLMAAAFCMVLLAYLFAIVIVGIFYSIAFEGSPLQATPGKLIMGLKVYGRKNKRPSLRGALIRALAKALSWLPCGAGFALVAISPDRRGLHDIISKTRVAETTPYSVLRRTTGFLIALSLAGANIALRYSQNRIIPTLEAPEGRSLPADQQALARQIESEMKRKVAEALNAAEGEEPEEEEAPPY